MKIEKAIRKSHCYNEDRYIIGESFYMVIDGATALYKIGIKPTEGSWFVSFIKRHLATKCKDVYGKMNEISKKAYAEFIALCKANNPDFNISDALYFPSAGLAFAEIKGEKVHIYTTGDCEALIRKKDGTLIRHIFPELARLDGQALEKMLKVKKEKGISSKQARKYCQDVLIKNRKLMNKKGGYAVYTVSDNPDFEFIKAEYDIDDIKELYLYTDGISQAYDDLGLYSSCEEMFREEIDLNKEIEKIAIRAYEDKDCEKYPRLKTIDDIAVIKLKFD